MKNSNLEVLGQALNKANQAGVFTLQESAMVLQALQGVAQHIQSLMPQAGDEEMLKESPIEQARREAREERGKKEPVMEVAEDRPSETSDKEA